MKTAVSCWCSKNWPNAAINIECVWRYFAIWLCLFQRPFGTSQRSLHVWSRFLVRLVATTNNALDKWQFCKKMGCIVLVPGTGRCIPPHVTYGVRVGSCGQIVFRRTDWTRFFRKSQKTTKKSQQQLGTTHGVKHLVKDSPVIIYGNMSIFWHVSTLHIYNHLYF